MAKKHPVEDYRKWVFKSRFYVLIAVVTVVVIVAVCPAREREQWLEILADNRHEEGLSWPEGCDLFDGKWVYDNQSHPLYKEKSCSFMALDFACESYGRKDLKYQNWRWQPHHCDLPRFNATEMLEGLRGRRLVFVGDSLNKNQFISMVCLVESVIPDPTLKTFYYHGSFVTFKALEYNAAIEFYWAPFLVESNNDNPFYHHSIDRIVRVKSIEKHARLWTDADILVFHSFLWWRLPKMKLLWGSFNSSDAIYKEVEVPRSYEMALQTWSDWLEIHVNRTKTKLYFMSMSPTHETYSKL
ncbi:Trichome birefringence-like, N-terminal domain [Dillenia turbinata]|uniref:Trichome birefringence-like, N-terminal domain n=1 Tax=Dillenia turbinata TaxID=194707 RepID=A0AAN8W8S0_9MAGN